jgi:hypothetical protein
MSDRFEEAKRTFKQRDAFTAVLRGALEDEGVNLDAADVTAVSEYLILSGWIDLEGDV